MFEETIRALRRLEGQTTVSVPIGDDEEGYFDRECPSEECLFQFKVLSEDWKDKVRDEEVFCPNCGHTAASGSWWTQEQLAHAREAALAQLTGTITGALKKDAASWNRRQPRKSFISMTMKVDSKPQHVPLPAAAAEPMRLKITCPACACRYAVVGAAYFCPACGHNAADQQFELTMAGIRQSLGAVDVVRAAIADRDAAESTVRLLVENGLQNAVTAFQRCAEALYLGFPSAPKARRNAFQNLTDGDALWKEATGRAYSDYLSTDAMNTLRRAFQQRHLLAHTQGIVDQDYINKSGVDRYRPGQRIVVRVDTVQEAVGLWHRPRIANWRRRNEIKPKEPYPMLTSQFDEALRYAHDLHRNQTRKGTSIPYISHLMTVSALVLEHGGTSDQAIGALLHDAAEDQGGAETLEEVRLRFGDAVAEIVHDCTDAWTEPKPAWRPRKEAYLAKLPIKPARSLLVSLADKTHNAEAILFDYRVLGDDLWPRFNGGAEGTRWYYSELSDVFAAALPGRLSDRLARAVAGFSK